MIGDWKLEFYLRCSGIMLVTDYVSDIAQNYDHKHQDISFDNNSTGLAKMSIDIKKSSY